MRDIRKSAYCKHRVQLGDGWPGPVIIKTDLNYGGKPEARLLHSSNWFKKLITRTYRLISQGYNHSSPKRRIDFRNAIQIDPLEYPIFDSVDDVPPEVFDNASLIVERFLRESTDEGFILRSYNFLGDQGFTRMRISDQPIVKAKNSKCLEPPEVPDSLEKFRSHFGLEYGKIDYLMYENEAIILDINLTPTIVVGSNHTRLLNDIRCLASGINSILWI